MILDYRTEIKRLNISLLEIQLNAKIDKSIVDTLDAFIEDIFNDYIILNTEYMGDNIYISSDMEQKMVTEIATIVGDRLSATMYKQLSVYYSESTIPTVISNKIYELVMAYAIEKNSVKSSNESNK
jgi:hypothetical protein